MDEAPNELYVEFAETPYAKRLAKTYRQQASDSFESLLSSARNSSDPAVVRAWSDYTRNRELAELLGGHRR